MTTTEHTINDTLAEVLMETRSLWRFKDVVRSENIDVLKSSGKRPDILITEPNVSPDHRLPPFFLFASLT